MNTVESSTVTLTASRVSSSRRCWRTEVVIRYSAVASVTGSVPSKTRRWMPQPKFGRLTRSPGTVSSSCSSSSRTTCRRDDSAAAPELGDPEREAHRLVHHAAPLSALRTTVTSAS